MIFTAYAYSYDSMVEVEWTAPSLPGTNPPPDCQTNWQFFLERKPAGSSDSACQTLTEVGFGLAYLDGDVVNGQSYTYRVTAFDQYYNRYTTNATATPSAGQGLTLLNPKPGNAYVDLAWSPIRANAFTVKHALKHDGPFEILAVLNTTNAYQSAPNTFRHYNAQNGVDHYYYVTATTPTGRQLDSDIKSARPLATLAPLPPAGFKATQVPGDDAGWVVLSWKPCSGAVQYQVFLQAPGGALSPLYQDNGTAQTSLLYNVPAGTSDGAQLVFAIRSLNQAGLTSELKQTTLAYQAQACQPSSTNAARVKVAGVLTNFSVIAPTNLTLTLDTALANVGQVTFLDNGQVLGMAGAPSFQITWFHPQGGTHLISATVQMLDTSSGLAPNNTTFTTASTMVTVTVKPDLAAYQTGVTDFQLPAPGLPIILSRSYNSRDTNSAQPALAAGWQASWRRGRLRSPPAWAPAGPAPLSRTAMS